METGDGVSSNFALSNNRSSGSNNNSYNRSSQYYGNNNNQASQYNNNGPSTSASALSLSGAGTLLDVPSGSGMSGSISATILKSGSPSRKRRRISGRMPSQSPPALWEQRRSPRMLVRKIIYTYISKNV